MMKALSVSFDNNGESSIRFSPEFTNADWLVKADALKDAAELLQWQYEQLMSIEDWKARSAFELNNPLKR
jgi:hypothetical protein